MKFVIATHNAHKVQEFRRILAPLGIEAVTAEISEPVEDGDSFMANARIKAENACRETGLPAVADDSGICVDVLNGRPGIFSARYGGARLDDRGRLDHLLEEMRGVPDGKRQAHFTSAICCVFPSGDRIEAEDSCFGTLAHEAQGSGGFGYDPIFMQDGVSFGTLAPEEKDKRSHRGKSLRAFAAKLNDYLNQIKR